MTDHMRNSLECVDPAWGDQLWRLADPDLDAVTEKHLQDHLFICDACRESQMIDETVAEAIRTGEVSVAPVRPARQPAWAWVGAVAVAASLALVFILPPGGREAGGVRRGDDEIHRFVRPVEGEVVHSGVPTMRWKPIPGASAYRVKISEVGGDYIWSTTTVETSVRVPTEHALPPAGLFRGVIQPVPTDLAGPVDVSVAFSRAGWRQYLAYRAGAAPLWLLLIGALGAVGAVVTLGWARRPTR